MRLMLRSMHLRGGGGEGRRREWGEALAKGQTGGRGAAEAQMLRAWGARCRGSVGRGARRRAARNGCVCVLVRPRQGTRRRTVLVLALVDGGPRAPEPRHRKLVVKAANVPVHSLPMFSRLPKGDVAFYINPLDLPLPPRQRFVSFATLQQRLASNNVYRRLRTG